MVARNVRPRVLYYYPAYRDSGMVCLLAQSS